MKPQTPTTVLRKKPRTSEVDSSPILCSAPTPPNKGASVESSSPVLDSTADQEDQRPASPLLEPFSFTQHVRRMRTSIPSALASAPPKSHISPSLSSRLNQEPPRPRLSTSSAIEDEELPRVFATLIERVGTRESEVSSLGEAAESEDQQDFYSAFSSLQPTPKPPGGLSQGSAPKGVTRGKSRPSPHFPAEKWVFTHPTPDTNELLELLNDPAAVNEGEATSKTNEGDAHTNSEGYITPIEPVDNRNNTESSTDGVKLHPIPSPSVASPYEPNYKRPPSAAEGMPAPLLIPPPPKVVSAKRGPRGKAKAKSGARNAGGGGVVGRKSAELALPTTVPKPTQTLHLMITTTDIQKVIEALTKPIGDAPHAIHAFTTPYIDPANFTSQEIKMTPLIAADPPQDDEASTRYNEKVVETLIKKTSLQDEGPTTAEGIPVSASAASLSAPTMVQRQIKRSRLTRQHSSGDDEPRPKKTRKALNQLPPSSFITPVASILTSDSSVVTSVDSISDAAVTSTTNEEFNSVNLNSGNSYRSPSLTSDPFEDSAPPSISRTEGEEVEGELSKPMSEAVSCHVPVSLTKRRSRIKAAMVPDEKKVRPQRNRKPTLALVESTSLAIEEEEEKERRQTELQLRRLRKEADKMREQEAKLEAKIEAKARKEAEAGAKKAARAAELEEKRRLRAEAKAAQAKAKAATKTTTVKRKRTLMSSALMAPSPPRSPSESSVTYQSTAVEEQVKRGNNVKQTKAKTTITTNKIAPRKSQEQQLEPISP